eukprot:1158697-Pelagomonas_calceolata.AAC.1
MSAAWGTAWKQHVSVCFLPPRFEVSTSHVLRAHAAHHEEETPLVMPHRHSFTLKRREERCCKQPNWHKHDACIHL